MSLDQSLKDIERFYSNKFPILYFSTSPANGTYNIANLYLIQAVCKNLAVVKRDTEKSLWFPGPSAFVQNLLEKEHR